MLPGCVVPGLLALPGVVLFGMAGIAECAAVTLKTKMIAASDRSNWAKKNIRDTARQKTPKIAVMNSISGTCMIVRFFMISIPD